jgi:putative ABC transport system permease protein
MNYSKIAWRNISKQKAFTFIYILGLAVGITAVMIDGLWIYEELYYNRYFKNYDRIAQVMYHETFNGERQTLPWNPYHLDQLIRKDYGNQFKFVVMSTTTSPYVLKFANTRVSKSGNFMDQDAPEMLSLPMEKGIRDGLHDPYSILLSQSLSKALFGEVDPINKVVHIANVADVKVTGVYRDFPLNTEFNGVSFIAPWKLLLIISPGMRGGNPWGNSNYFTYVQLTDKGDMMTASRIIHDLISKNIDKTQAAELKPVAFLQPMSRWHLYSEFKNGVNIGGRIEYVWLFSIVGLFVLFLACINFVNLSTANAQSRAKEIGIRKTIGSSRKQLIWQFLTEALLIVLFSFVFSLILMGILLPFFNQISSKQLYVPWTSASFWVVMFIFCTLTTLAAGMYPSFYLSSFQPVKVLKGAIRVGRAAVLRRKSLVVLQFTTSIVLIIGTMVVIKQINFAKDRQLGYNPNNLISVPSSLGKDFNAFRNELMKSGAAVEVTESANPLTDNYIIDGRFSWEGKDPNQSIAIPISNVSRNYGKTVGWQIKEGRDFSKDFLTDSSAFIINEAAVTFMGLKTPIGKTIEWDKKPFHIIGVIKNIIVESPYQTIQPYIYQATGDQAYITTIRLNARMGIQQSLNKIRNVFNKFNPEIPFDFTFIDQEYSRKFSDEERIGKLTSLLTFLAVFISCLGIFGLATLLTDQRLKEIGIRKVLGSSAFNIWKLLSNEFIKLTFLSMLIASPLAYYFMNNWLQNYAYHTDISWAFFAATGISLLFITLLTISYQIIKAALANPIKILRLE